MQHVCFGGSPACSGINPCQGCQFVINERILAPAMWAAGFAGDQAQAAAFFHAYREATAAVHRWIVEHPHHVTVHEPVDAHAPTLNGAEAPLETSSEVFAPTEPAPAAAEEAETLLGEGRDVMGPMSPEELSSIMLKAQRMTSPVEEPEQKKGEPEAEAGVQETVNS